MPDNLRYIHGGWLVVRASHARQFMLHTRWLVSGTSIACPKIYTTYTVVGWWYKRRMPDNLHYIHGVWLVVRPTIYFTNTEATVSSWGVKLMASNENLYFHDVTRSLTRHVDIQVVTIRLMTCQCMHSLRFAPQCC